MPFLDGRRQHEHLAGVARNQGEAASRCLHVGERPQRAAQPADLDAQACPMRFVGELQCERRAR